MLAITVDVGQLYVEKRQLQNVADAGALAVAQRCAHYQAKCNTITGNLSEIADNNSQDNTSTVSLVCGWAWRGPGPTTSALTACPAMTTAKSECETVISAKQQYARVYATTRTKSGGNTLTMLFARALSGGSAFANGITVKACGQAVWGGVGKATVKMPFALSGCSFTSLTQQTVVDANSTCTGKSTLSGTQVTSTHVGVAAVWCDSASCTSADGLWNQAADLTCTRSHTMLVGEYYDYVNSGHAAKLCPGLTNGLADAMRRELGNWNIVPVFDSLPNNGANQQLKVVSFMLFKLQAFAVKGTGNTLNSGAVAGTTMTWTTTNCPNVCVAGMFSEQLTLDGNYSDPATIPDYGVQTLRLVP